MLVTQLYLDQSRAVGLGPRAGKSSFVEEDHLWMMRPKNQFV